MKVLGMVWKLFSRLPMPPPKQISMNRKTAPKIGSMK